MNNLIKNIVLKLKEESNKEWNTFDIPSNDEVNNYVLKLFFADGYDLENDDHIEIFNSYMDNTYDALYKEITSLGGEVIFSSPDEKVVSEKLAKTSLSKQYLERFELAYKF